MTAALTTAPTLSPAAHLTSWWDPAGECTVTIAEPAAAPELFAEYHDGAVASYAKFGVSDAIDPDAGRCANDTALFWTMTDVEGRMIGGVRTKGVLTVPEDSHAVVEWRGRPGEADVHRMLADRIPSGVIEMKAAWMRGDGDRSPSRAKLHARSGFHLTTCFDVDYYMATSAAHCLERWRSTGGVVAPIPATPYPDERYQTKMMWWDRRTFTRHGEPEQIDSLLHEMARIDQTWPRGGVDDRVFCLPSPRTLSPRVRAGQTAMRLRR